MNDNTKKVAIGTLVAAAAGYVAGILTAPKSGRETRRALKGAAIQAKREAEKKLKILHSELNDLLQEAKKRAKGLKKDAAENFATVITQAQFAKEKAREVLSALHDGDASDEELATAISNAKQAVEHLKVFLKKNSSQSN